MMLPTLLLAFSVNSTPSIEPQLARRYFQEARWACEDDGGKLWGKNLWGPIVFVNPTTREAVCSAPAPGFEAQQGVWVGKLPDSLGVANTATEWGGQTWTIVMWPPPANPTDRCQLLIHELYHRIQSELGLPANIVQNQHLDSLDGRIWIQMEALALGRALQADSNERSQSVRDALTFRAKRQSLFGGAKTEEDMLEMNEGLAEFTGCILNGTRESDSRMRIGRQLSTSFGNRENYSRSFAYGTGPAYAMLLNLEESALLKKTWRAQLSPKSSLAQMLAERLKFRPDPKQASARASRYGFARIRPAEEGREKHRTKLTQTYEALFIKNPVLVLPLNGGNLSYDPYKVFALGKHGNVYTGASITHDWGSVKVESSILVDSMFATARVSIKSNKDMMSGAGWKLNLKPGWKVIPGARKGDYTIAAGG